MNHTHKKTDKGANVPSGGEMFSSTSKPNVNVCRSARKYFAAAWNGRGLKQSLHQGFTLLETLFSILIFSAALVALMTIAARGISATESAQQETVAHYLAQEGLETARNIRDTNYLSQGANAWDGGFSNCVLPGGCSVIYGSSNPTLSPSTCTNLGQPTACPVYQNANGVFTDVGTASAYKRSVVAVAVPPTHGTTSDEYTVTSTVSWVFKTIPRTVSLTTILKKWQ